MSRHKLVKNMNLVDELDTFDGGGGYGYEDEETAGDGKRLGLVDWIRY